MRFNISKKPGSNATKNNEIFMLKNIFNDSSLKCLPRSFLKNCNRHFKGKF